MLLLLRASVLSQLPSIYRRADPTFPGTSSHSLPIETNTTSRAVVVSRLTAAMQRVRWRNVTIKEEFLTKRHVLSNLKVSVPVNLAVLGMAVAQSLANTRSPSPSNRSIATDSITISVPITAMAKIMQIKSSSEQLKSKKQIQCPITGRIVSGKPAEDLSA